MMVSPGRNPCASCEKWGADKVCKERKDCRTWGLYSFKRSLRKAQERKRDQQDFDTIRRLRQSMGYPIKVSAKREV